MKQKIGFLALGQCGGNIGSIFEQHGYNCLFINTSEEDLSTLNVKYRYHIRNGNGCNHNRDKAIQLIKADFNNIIDEIKDKLSEQQLIYLIFSTAGGSGSGFAPILLESLSSIFSTKYFGCIAVLPDEDETPRSQLNAFKCYQEITQIDKITSVFTLDNSKFDKFAINNAFVNLFVTALDIVNHRNIKGNIDVAEIWEMLITRGNIIITEVHSNNPNNLTSSIIKSWEQNIFADIEKNKQIMYMGLSLTADVNIDDLRRFIGNPFDIFKNYNRDTTITILSGLLFPKTRIDKITSKLNSNKETIKNIFLNTKTNKINETFDWLKDLENKQSENVVGDLDDLNEIMARY